MAHRPSDGFFRYFMPKVKILDFPAENGYNFNINDFTITEDFLMDILDQISREAYKAGEFLAKKAVVAKDYTVASWNVAELRAEIEEHHKQIGILVCRSQTDGEDTSAAIRAHVEAVRELSEKLEATEEERQNLCNRKRCPACSKPIAKANAYCPHCGASVK